MKKSRTRERSLISDLEALQATQEDADKVLAIRKRSKEEREAKRRQKEEKLLEKNKSETHINEIKEPPDNNMMDEENEPNYNQEKEAKSMNGGKEEEEDEEEEEEENDEDGALNCKPLSKDKLSPTKYERDLIKELLSVQAMKGKPLT